MSKQQNTTPAIDLDTDPVLAFLFKKIGNCMLADLQEEELIDFLTEFYKKFIIIKNDKNPN